MADAQLKKALELARLLNPHLKVDASTSSDLISELITRLEEQLKQQEEVHAISSQIHNLQEVIEDYSALRFSSKAPIEVENSPIDTLAESVNALGEKLSSATVSRSDLDNVLKNMVGLVFVMTMQGKILMVNEGVSNRLGYNEGELLGTYLSDLIEFPKDNATWFNSEEELLTYCKTKGGNTIPISLSVTAMQSKAGEIPNFVCVAHDVSDRHEAAEKLEESEYMFRNLVETMNDGVIIVDREQRIQYVNQHLLEMLGYEEAEILGKNAKETLAHEDDHEFIDQTFSQRLKGQKGRYEIQVSTKSGERLWMHLSSSPVLNAHNEVVGSMVVHSDITYRKMAEFELQGSLKEKEMLIKEVHHRVKNNLQVISSLLSLQSSTVDNDLANAILRESQNRIKSMAAIHEKLYQSKNLSSIDFQDYTEDIVHQLGISYGTDKENVRIVADVRGIYLGVDTAVPCGLILNELVSNSLKYAFPEQEEGEIKIHFRKCSSGQYVLKVSDNGIGFPESVDFRDTTSLGLQLVTTLTEQLDGEIELHRQQGTCFSIRFRIEE